MEKTFVSLEEVMLSLHKIIKNEKETSKKEIGDLFARNCSLFLQHFEKLFLKMDSEKNLNQESDGDSLVKPMNSTWYLMRKEEQLMKTLSLLYTLSLDCLKIKKLDKTQKIQIEESAEKLCQWYQKLHPEQRLDIGQIQERLRLEALNSDFITQEGIEGAFINLELIKKDRSYELFFMKDSFNKPYYNNTLNNALRMLCLFNEDFVDHTGQDPLLFIPVWNDEYFYRLAHEITTKSGLIISKFFKHTHLDRKTPNVEPLFLAVMALYLAKNPLNMASANVVKSSQQYFQDFIYYLRDFYHQGYVYYQDTLFLKKDHGSAAAITLVMTWVKNYFESSKLLTHFHSHFKKFYENMPLSMETIPLKYSKSLQTLHILYHQISRNLIKHPNGPLFKTLDLVAFKQYNKFDPYVMGAFSSYIESYKIDGRDAFSYRAPFPTHQTTLEKVAVNPEFLIYLDHQVNQGQKVLLILCGDRQNWMESSRFYKMEALIKNSQYYNHLEIISLDMDSSFYHQLEAWSNQVTQKEFKEYLKSELFDLQSGYFFSNDMQNYLKKRGGELIDQICQNYSMKNREGRQLCIDLIYHALVWEVMQKFAPHKIFFMSKDGLDLVSTFALANRYLLDHQGLSNNLNYITDSLFLPTLFFRERLIQEYHFYRFLNLLEQAQSMPTKYTSLI